MAVSETIGTLHGAMMIRCYKTTSVMYKDYGAKGIGVCEEWHDREVFRKWAIENGWEKGLRLERINTKEGYSPINCRFGKKYRSHTAVAKNNGSIEHNKQMKEWCGLNEKDNKRLNRIYKNMRARCYNPNNTQYKDYGGRGIKICDEWLLEDGYYKFYKWCMDNGYDSTLTIDRIDVNGNYEPSNCRWATTTEQGNNKRNSRKYEYYGEIKTITEICRIEDISFSALKRRLDDGMNLYEAIARIKHNIDCRENNKPMIKKGKIDDAISKTKTK